MTCFLSGHLDPDQILPRRFHKGAGELAVEVGQTLDVFMSRLAAGSCWFFIPQRPASIQQRKSHLQNLRAATVELCRDETELQDRQNISRQLTVNGKKRCEA